MTTILKLRARAAAKRAEANKILDAVAAGGVHRDLTSDEQTRFEALMGEVEGIKAQIALAQKIEEDEAADQAATAADQAAAAERSVRRSDPPRDAPAVHAEKRTYSILRALRLATDQRPLDGLEGEISREIEKRSGRVAKGFFMPTGLDPELRRLASGGAVRRDLTTTTGTGAIFVEPDLPFIELLRARLVIRALGARFLTDVQGQFAIPRQTATASVYWLAEGIPASPSNQALDQVPFSPRVAIALTNISRKFMLQTSVDAEQFVKEDLAATMARELDRVSINGTGGAQPLGILQNTTIQANSAGLALGANGGVPTFAAIVAMESLIASYNADMGSLAYLTTPSMRGTLKTTAKTAAGYPVFLFEGGQMNGHPVQVSTNVPANLTKGTGTGLSAILFGNWSDLIVAQWEGVDILVNPYTNQASGAVTISSEMSVDSVVRHPESFAIITDAHL